VKLGTGSPGGLLLISASLKPLYANAEALEILAYPQKPDTIPSIDSFLEQKIRSALLNELLSRRSKFVHELTSGKRRYRCRAFALTPPSKSSSNAPSIAVLIERCSKPKLDTSYLLEKYGLTQRERETVDFLAQGLTSKEIAARMNISPNTVKAFLRLIMMKMGVSTRSGIIGKVLEARL